LAFSRKEKDDWGGPIGVTVVSAGRRIPKKLKKLV